MDFPGHGSAAEGATGTVAVLARNLRGGWRLGLLQRVQREEFTASADAFAVLVVLNVAVLVALDFMSVGLEGEFNFYELPRALMFAPLTLLFGLLVERASGSQGLMVMLSVALVAAGTVLTVVFGLLGLLLQHQAFFLLDPQHWEILFYAGSLWWCLILVVSVWRLAPLTLRQYVAHAIAGLALLVAPEWWYPQSYLWAPAYDRAAGSGAGPALAEEHAFYAQHDILRNALEALEPERPGIADLYVLAAGLYAREDVFMKEVEALVDLFRREFDAEGRALALINNPRTVEAHPVASLTSLTAALRHIGMMMNADEDVLLLYVSSHGSETHELSVDFPPLSLVPIDPPALKQALDDSGIKWKVIVVSACYSGGFIEPLKDDHAMIITASSAKKQSFGCGTESDSTYLARALFEEALRQTRSFEAAFHLAREAIARRERAQGFSPSEPQMFVGAAMREKLKQVESRLQARAR